MSYYCSIESRGIPPTGVVAFFPPEAAGMSRLAPLGDHTPIGGVVGGTSHTGVHSNKVDRSSWPHSDRCRADKSQLSQCDQPPVVTHPEMKADRARPFAPVANPGRYYLPSGPTPSERVGNPPGCVSTTQKEQHFKAFALPVNVSLYNIGSILPQSKEPRFAAWRRKAES